MEKTKINRELLAKVARNARLELTEKEIESFLPQFREILDAFEKIGQVEIKNTEPAFHPIPLQNRCREDKTNACLSNEEALANAVHQKQPYFKGPKAIEQT
jgi:aspartyl-tRNA(Asn)/glutamyl-tRNA(Gln) amidotransferase subunit C